MNCGKKLPDNAKFCSACGADTSYEDVTVNAGAEKNIKDHAEASSGVTGKKRFLIPVLSVVCLLVFTALILIAVRIFHRKTMGNEQSDAAVTDERTVSEDMTEMTDTGNDTEPAEDTRASSGEKAENEESESEEAEEEQEPYILLLCASVTGTPVYSAPDAESAPLAELSVGTALKWSGEVIGEEDERFCEVSVVDSSLSGYVSWKDCVPVNCETEETASIIEVDSILYTYEMMVDDIEQLCRSYPGIVSSSVIGESLDGRNIYALVLGNPDADKHILAHASIHGREYMVTPLVMKMIEYYASRYDDGNFNGISYRELFENTALHVIPMVNPDGVVIAQKGVSYLNNQYFADIVYEAYEADRWYLQYEEDTNGDWQWGDHFREENYNVLNSENPTMISFDEYQRNWKANARGVDLNNNFDAGWEDTTSKEYASFSKYKGPYPLSEPESAALADYAKKYDFLAFLSYHCRGQVIYYDVNGNSEDNSERSKALAERISSLNKHKLYNNKKAYNVSMGGFGDWAQLYFDRPGATIECGYHPCPLLIDEFAPMYIRNREVWAMLAYDERN